MVITLHGTGPIAKWKSWCKTSLEQWKLSCPGRGRSISIFGSFFPKEVMETSLAGHSVGQRTSTLYRMQEYIFKTIRTPDLSTLSIRDVQKKSFFNRFHRQLGPSWAVEVEGLPACWRQMAEAHGDHPIEVQLLILKLELKSFSKEISCLCRFCKMHLRLLLKCWVPLPRSKTYGRVLRDTRRGAPAAAYLDAKGGHGG